uniref:Uncharacterized protein LOC104212666 n=1 Tax=Nicotiana sylvestris TaxID=4096 RepID=A0A1U7UW96_NICSY|nr:PREDICTED: uncharacterized protein LOC104212666 [Nicotiana sylvestris]
MGQISQALNTRPKGVLTSDTVVNPKCGNNMVNAMDIITRSGRCGNAPTSSQRQLVDDEQVVQEEEIPNNVVQPNDEVNPSRDHIIDIPKLVVQRAKAPLPKPPPPYPQRLAKQNGEKQFKKFIQMIKILSINVPLVEALEKMLGYAKFMNDLVTKKRSMNFETIKVTHQVSAIVHLMAPKLEDPGAFTIPCTIGIVECAKALCDLGESINLIPYPIFKKLGIGKARPTSMRLQMVDRTMKRYLGVIEDVLVRIDKFIIPVDFVILDCEVDYEVQIILGRPFLATGKALCDVKAGELTFRVDNKKVVFHVCKSMRQPNSNETSVMINVGDMLKVVLLNFDDDEMDGFMEYDIPDDGRGGDAAVVGLERTKKKEVWENRFVSLEAFTSFCTWWPVRSLTLERQFL